MSATASRKIAGAQQNPGDEGGTAVGAEKGHSTWGPARTDTCHLQGDKAKAGGTKGQPRIGAVDQVIPAVRCAVTLAAGERHAGQGEAGRKRAEGRGRH